MIHMKNPLRTLALLSGAALLASSNLSAETVSTNPVGYVTVDLPAGASLVSVPLISRVQYVGAAGDVVGSVVSLSGLPDPVTIPSYIHVLSGTAAGTTVSVLSSNSSSVTLEAEVVGLALGDSLRIVEHFTLADIAASSSAGIADGSVVTIYNSDASSDSYTVYSNTWYDADFSVADDVIIFAGEGFVVNLQAATSLTFTGAVNTEPVNVEVTSGTFSLIGSVNPTAPVGGASVGAALGSALADGSTLTVYSEDGLLTVEGTYTCYSGVWYDSSFTPTDISIASPSVVVVNPQSTVQVSMPSAY